MKTVEEQLVHIRSRLDLVAKLDFPPGSFVSVPHGNVKVEIDIPFDKQTLREVRRTLGRGWKLDTRGVVSLTSSSAFVGYRHINTGIVFDVNLNLFTPGSTCRRVQVGEETRPVYKIVCD